MAKDSLYAIDRHLLNGWVEGLVYFLGFDSKTSIFFRLVAQLVGIVFEIPNVPRSSSGTQSTFIVLLLLKVFTLVK